MSYCQMMWISPGQFSCSPCLQVLSLLSSHDASCLAVPVLRHCFANIELSCMLALPLYFVFQILSKMHTVRPLHIGSYKALRSKHVLPEWPVLCCALNPKSPNTHSYLNFPYDATCLPSIANLKPSAYFGLCVLTHVHS
jgi:hypothetical protein